MVKITKVYTRTGDTGQTGIVGGKRIPNCLLYKSEVADEHYGGDYGSSRKYRKKKKWG